MADEHTSAGTTGARADALELIASDHRAVEQLFRALEAADPQSDIARATAERIIRELSVHATVEEEMFYPALRTLPGGDSLADHAVDEHQELKELLASVDGKAVDDPDVRSTFARIRATVETHVADEESVLFGRMRELGEPRLMEMGSKMETAKKAAPTHPHPRAPNTPPGNVIAGLAAAAVDRVRDAIRSVRS